MNTIVSARAWIRHPAIVLSGLALAASFGAQAEIRYSITDLDGSTSYAYGVNSNGQVVGVFQPGTGYGHGFLYSGGSMTDLGTLGGVWSHALGLNNRGHVVGASYYAGGGFSTHAFLYRDGSMVDLGTLGGAYSTASSINDSGQVVGSAHIGDGSFYHAFLYSGGSKADLGTLGGRESWAVGINEEAKVVGGSYTAGGFCHAFLYSGGVMADLGTLGGTYSAAYDINDNGQVVGDADTVNRSRHAFRYSNGMMSDLGALGYSSSRARGINNKGQVVGSVSTSAGEHACLWHVGAFDLNRLVDPDSGWTLNGAMDINDRGQIVGYGINPAGHVHAFLLTPNRPPVAQCRNVAVAGGANCAADASVNDGSFDPDGGPVTLTQSPPGSYPLGTNSVRLTVTDSHGASNSCSALVIVLDMAPPQLTCPTNITVDCTNLGGVTVTFAPATVDNCSAVPAISCLPASGSTFPIGTTTVLCTAVDASGNSASCSFQVTVLSPRQMLERLLSLVNSSVARPQPLAATLSAALPALDRGNALAAVNQLIAFQNQVRAQVASGEPTLASRLTAAAQDLIHVLASGA